MPLATRIIPTLLCRGRQLVKGQRFDAWRSVGLVAQAVRVHQMRGVDELVLLDITATAEGRGPDLALIEELSDVLYCPLAVGGGVRSVADVKALLRAGADKVVMCTTTFHTDELEKASAAVGCQALVVAIDARAGGVWSNSGTERWNLRPASYARLCEESGAGELLLTSIDREGTMQGYDLELIRAVSSAVTIPVIAHGGAGTYEHMREAIEAGASAVAAGALFQFCDATPRGAAEYLQAQGIEVRT